MKPIYTLPLALLFLPLELFADFPLIREGKIEVTISNAQPESVVTRYAVRELQQTLQQMAAGEVAVTSSLSDKASSPRIVIGAHSHLPAEAQTALKLSGGNPDEVLVQEHEGTLWITGPTERAALYATYTFLDEVGGVRWLWPGEEGTRIPRPKELVMKQERLHHLPDMAYRNLAISGKQDYDEELYTWLARNRQNLANIEPWRPAEIRQRIPFLQEKGFQIRMSGHGVVLPQALLDKHPEYMALYSGERKVFHHHGAHLCWSNPEVQKALSEEVVKWVDLFPEIDIASLYTADHSFYCECENCIAMGPDITTRWHQLSKVLIKALRAHRPDLKIWTLAYDRYRSAPQEVAPYDLIQYAIYDASYRQPLSSGSPANTKALNAMKQWQDRGATLGLRQYEMISLRQPSPFMPLVYFMADQFAFAKANGMPNYTSEILPIVFPATTVPEERNWNGNRMNVYAAVRAMWNASYTSEQLVNDWAQAAYHSAAPAMEKYYYLFEKAWRESPLPLSDTFTHAGAQISGFITPTLISRAEAALEEAKELALGIKDEREREEAQNAIAMDERMFGVWRSLYRTATPEGDPAIYRLLPLTEKAWSIAPVVSLTTVDGKPTGDTAQMLWDDGALRVRWQPRKETGSTPPAPLTVRIQSILHLGRSVEITLSPGVPDGEITALNCHWSRKEPLTPLPEAKSDDTGTREIIIRTPELAEMHGTFGRLYVSLASGGGTKAATWPTHPVAYGVLSATERPTPRVAFVDITPGSASGAYPIMRRHGWDVRRTTSDLIEVLPESDLTLLNYDNGENFKLSNKAVRDALKPYFERGGVLLVHASESAPVDDWVGDKTLAFHRVGRGPEEIVRRITTTTRAGDWTEKPNPLKFWKSGITPYYGLSPENPERWENFATLSMKDGREIPWLMATKIDKGWLLVTTESMGYSGGFSVLGDRFAERVLPFVENLMLSLGQQTSKTRN